MTTFQLTQRERRLLRTAGVIVPALLLCLRGLPLWWSWRSELRDRAVTSATQAARASMLLAGAAALKDSLGARRLRLQKLSPLLLPAGDPAVAPAILADRIDEASRATGVRVDGIEASAPREPQGQLRRVSAKVQAVTDAPGLANLLLQLDRGPTLLAIRRLSIQSRGIEAGQVELLTVQLTVEGVFVTGNSGSIP